MLKSRTIERLKKRQSIRESIMARRAARKRMIKESEGTESISLELTQDELDVLKNLLELVTSIATPVEDGEEAADIEGDGVFGADDDAAL